MIDGISHTGYCLTLGHGERVGWVDERTNGPQMLVHITNLVVGICTADHSSRIIFATRSCHGHNVHDRQSSLRFHLIRNQIPWVAVIFCTSRDGLGTVEHTSAAHSQNHINMIFLAKADTIQYARVVFRVGFNPAELRYFKVF